MPAEPAAPAARPPTRPKCPRCAGFLLRQTLYDPEAGPEAVLTCVNCGWEQLLQPGPDLVDPTTPANPTPPEDPINMIEETPQKLHFHRPEDSKRWPPEARQYVEQMVAANPKLRRTALATLIDEQSNIPYATALSWVSNAQNAKNGRDPETVPHRPQPAFHQTEEAPTAPEPETTQVDEPKPTPPMADTKSTPLPLPAPDNPTHQLAHQLLAAASGAVVTRLAITPDTVILETAPPAPGAGCPTTNLAAGPDPQP